MCEHLNLLFPQWQGGPHLQVYYGAMQLAEAIGKEIVLREIPVALTDEPEVRQNIRSYQSITNQLVAAIETVNAYCPTTIFTIGGNCSATIPSIAYLNQRFDGDLAVVWLDAHGDINTPESSLSKLFTGMPIRHLLGEGDSEIGRMLESYLKPEQIILAGTRDLDLAESEYIKMTEIKILPPEALESSPESVACCLSDKGYTHVYVHIDTDVLKEDSFRFSAWSSKHGITMKTLIDVLDNINNKFHVVGASLVEFVPCDTIGTAQLLLMAKKVLSAITPNSPGK